MPRQATSSGKAVFSILPIAAVAFAIGIFFADIESSVPQRCGFASFERHR